MSDRYERVAACPAHSWAPSTVEGHLYCTRCPATTRHHTPDPRRDPVDVIDQIDELVNDSLNQ
jgi:hypothetical protein